MRRKQTALALALVPVAALSMSGCRGSGAKADAPNGANPRCRSWSAASTR